MVWPMKVATKAPVTPTAVARIRPDGSTRVLSSFEARDTPRMIRTTIRMILAIIPAMKPIKMIQMIFSTTISLERPSGVQQYRYLEAWSWLSELAVRA
jgi:hypothetical protein